MKKLVCTKTYYDNQVQHRFVKDKIYPETMPGAIGKKTYFSTLSGGIKEQPAEDIDLSQEDAPKKESKAKKAE